MRRRGGYEGECMPLLDLSSSSSSPALLPFSGKFSLKFRKNFINIFLLNLAGKLNWYCAVMTMPNSKKHYSLRAIKFRVTCCTS